MINLILAILFSSILFVVLKSFSKFSVNTLHAIIVNYIVAFSVGILNSTETISLTVTTQKPWFIACLFLGALFIGIFFIIGKTSQKMGFQLLLLQVKCH